MAMSHRLFLIATSVIILILIAISLSTAIEVGAPPPKMMQVFLAQAAKYGGGHEVGAKALFNGTTALPRPDEPPPPSTSQAPATQTPVLLPIDGNNPPAQPPTPSATTPPQLPILALTYSHSSGPKHCRGSLVQQTTFPRPLSTWKAGTCITLPSPARCGVFWAAKSDGCEAHLFTDEDCFNSTSTYVNTVVFMPEERAVGALWRSMFVRCGVEAKEVGMLDPAILGGLLKKPGERG